MNKNGHAIFSDLQCTVTPGDADDHCKIVIRCRNGVVIDAETSNCIAFNGPDWMIAGTRGGLVAHEGGIHLKYFDPSRAPRIEMRDGAAWRRRYENDDVLPWQAKHLPNTQSIPPADFYEGVYFAVREGQAPPVTPESVRPTIAVLEKVRRQNPHLWEGPHSTRSGLPKVGAHSGSPSEISSAKDRIRPSPTTPSTTGLSVGDPRALPLPLRNSAFTLVELLVVIAIMAIMAALLSPALKQAREQARMIKCVSNVKQLCLAWEIYTTESNGKLPHVVLYTDSWAYRLASIIRETELATNVWGNWRKQGILACPSYVDKLASDGYHGFSLLYGMPPAMAGLAWDSAVTYDQVSEIKSPAQQILFVDARYDSVVWPNYGCIGYVWGYPNGDWPGDQIHFRHLGRAVCGYPDGHVDTKTSQDLTAFSPDWRNKPPFGPE